MEKYNFIADPGHGWLEVTIEEIRELGIAKDISGFSYRTKTHVYLEEDCDASVFLKAKKEEIETEYVYQEVTPIRNYAAYSSWYIE